MLRHKQWPFLFFFQNTWTLTLTPAEPGRMPCSWRGKKKKKKGEKIEMKPKPPCCCGRWTVSGLSSRHCELFEIALLKRTESQSPLPVLPHRHTCWRSRSCCIAVMWYCSRMSGLLQRTGLTLLLLHSLKMCGMQKQEKGNVLKTFVANWQFAKTWLLSLHLLIIQRWFLDFRHR